MGYRAAVSQIELKNRTRDGDVFSPGDKIVVTGDIWVTKSNIPVKDIRIIFNAQEYIDMAFYRRQGFLTTKQSIPTQEDIDAYLKSQKKRHGLTVERVTNGKFVHIIQKQSILRNEYSVLRTTHRHRSIMPNEDDFELLEHDPLNEQKPSTSIKQTISLPRDIPPSCKLEEVAYADGSLTCGVEYSVNIEVVLADGAVMKKKDQVTQGKLIHIGTTHDAVRDNSFSTICLRGVRKDTLFAPPYTRSIGGCFCTSRAKKEAELRLSGLPLYIESVLIKEHPFVYPGEMLKLIYTVENQTQMPIKTIAVMITRRLTCHALGGRRIRTSRQVMSTKVLPPSSYDGEDLAIPVKRIEVKVPSYETLQSFSVPSSEFTGEATNQNRMIFVDYFIEVILSHHHSHSTSNVIGSDHDARMVLPICIVDKRSLGHGTRPVSAPPVRSPKNKSKRKR